ncbi:hypothetical protein POJ06DRAFT_284591 [Lipomyces tetrasporus]|uniref:Retrotransposon gag domain-containing protein n=1 Tax=Lipomyces tetrasporus TaxID=54092 RepID=A0AAD7QY95_9ASCO|nr:uncharacterized protein POJ06DRAFT_284591 [Lipomyces tetrasporus]KAJ8103664.1 hypothetical protein POJ06DRAFT_284591 [Lipomyces tetrasporus]
MVRPTRAYFANAASVHHEDYDEDVSQWHDAAGASGATASPEQINRAIRELLDGGLDRDIMEPVLRALASDSIYLQSLIEESTVAERPPGCQGDLREALAQADADTDIARREADQVRATYRGKAAPEEPNAPTAAHLTKPREFKGTEFGGQSFLNRLELAFRLYSDGFPDDEFKVAYAITGLGERPSDWDWAAFRKALTTHYEDPDRLANQRERLLSLRYKGGDFLDHITDFETLCAQVDWPAAGRDHGVYLLRLFMPGPPQSDPTVGCGFRKLRRCQTQGDPTRTRIPGEPESHSTPHYLFGQPSVRSTLGGRPGYFSNQPRGSGCGKHYRPLNVVTSAGVVSTRATPFHAAQGRGQLIGRAWLQEREIRILYDTGSDGNFISPKIVQAMKLEPVQRGPLTVQGANGTIILVGQDIPIRLQALDAAVPRDDGTAISLRYRVFTNHILFVQKVEACSCGYPDTNVRIFRARISSAVSGRGPVGSSCVFSGYFRGAHGSINGSRLSAEYQVRIVDEDSDEHVAEETLQDTQSEADGEITDVAQGGDGRVENGTV